MPISGKPFPFFPERVPSGHRFPGFFLRNVPDEWHRACQISSRNAANSSSKRRNHRDHASAGRIVGIHGFECFGRIGAWGFGDRPQQDSARGRHCCEDRADRHDRSDRATGRRVDGARRVGVDRDRRRDEKGGIRPGGLYSTGRVMIAPVFASGSGAQIRPSWLSMTRRAMARLNPQPPRHSSNWPGDPSVASTESI